MGQGGGSRKLPEESAEAATAVSREVRLDQVCNRLLAGLIWRDRKGQISYCYSQSDASTVLTIDTCQP